MLKQSSGMNDSMYDFKNTEGYVRALIWSVSLKLSVGFVYNAPHIHSHYISYFYSTNSAARQINNIHKSPQFRVSIKKSV